MSDEFLGDRRRALEEAFFAQREQQLRERLREKAVKETWRQGLAEASGIRDEAVLDRLASLGVEPETVAALTLVPLVEVAWADGDVHPKEKAAVLKAAANAGIEEGSAASELLAGWLEERPKPELRAAWTAYAGALAGMLDATERAALKEDLMGRARSVAAAAGGFLGMGRISNEEEAALAALEGALSA